MILTRASFQNIYTATLRTNNLKRTYIVAIKNIIRTDPERHLLGFWKARFNDGY